MVERHRTIACARRDHCQGQYRGTAAEALVGFLQHDDVSIYFGKRRQDTIRRISTVGADGLVDVVRCNLDEHDALKQRTDEAGQSLADLLQL